MIRRAAAYAVAASIGAVVGTFTGAVVGAVMTTMMMTDKQTRDVVINHYMPNDNDENEDLQTLENSFQPQDVTLDEVDLTTSADE